MRIAKPIPKLSKEDLARFWELVYKRGPDECWPWLGSRTKAGYGTFGYNKGSYYAHRVAASLARKITVNLHVCHNCDNPPCCNPRHTFNGSDKDNSKDSAHKKRCGAFTKPWRYPQIKMSFIRAKKVAAAKGVQTEIARRFKISQSTVSRVKTGRIWRDEY
jgi:hypothetical protein